MNSKRRSILAAGGALVAVNWQGPAHAETAGTNGPAVNLSERHHLIAARIAALGVDLGRSEPGGKYASVLEDRGVVQVSGMVPSLDGQIVATGRVGAELTLEQAQHAAMISTLRCLDALRAHLGDLGRIRKVTKMTVFAQSAPDFHQLSEVSAGASETLHAVLAPFGEHARTTVGVFALPRNAGLELDMTVAVEPA